MRLWTARGRRTCAALSFSASVLVFVLATASSAHGESTAQKRDRDEAAESAAQRQQGTGATESVVVDRVVVRFTAAEAGGEQAPYFIHERELAFEARLVALADPAFRGGTEPYRRHHLQAALERHIAEVLLSVLSLDPEPSKTTVDRQQKAAWKMAEQEVGGRERLLQVARAEGIATLELRRLFRRRALASLYLDQMVAPMLEPSELELRRTHARGETPFSEEPFGEVRNQLEQWYVSRALKVAAANFFQKARARLRIKYL